MKNITSTIASATRYSSRNVSGRRTHFSAACSGIHSSNLHRKMAGTAGSPLSSLATLSPQSATGNYLFLVSLDQSGRFFSLTNVAAGRSRKRPRPSARLPSIGRFSDDVSNDGRTRGATHSSGDKTPPEAPHDGRNEESSLPYPEGKPWRVLWPRPHGDPGSSDSSLVTFWRRIPTTEQIRRAWSLYKQTWEDGISGIPSKRKDRTSTSEDGAPSEGPATHTQQQLQDIGDNAASNLRIVRKDAQELLEHTKETTGIRTQDDLKALASEAMKIATECIREFMAGYRKGRDSEIDKMLHEYFQEEGNDSNGENELSRETTKGESSNGRKNGKGDETAATTTSTDAGGMRRRKKRKPKRGIPRS